MGYQLRDLLYFDFDKAASLWSQLAGGLRERVSSTAEEQKEGKRGLSLGIPKIFEASLGGMDAEKKSTLESKVLHHDLLNLLENGLTELGLVTDLNEKVAPSESSADAIRDAMKQKPYVIAKGWSAIEDYQRIHSTAGDFETICDFVGTCAAQGQPGFQQLLRTRQEKKQALLQEKDRNKQTRINFDLNKVENQIREETRKIMPMPEPWLLDGIRRWIKIFMRDRINFRIFPFENCPAFQLLCNLKRGFCRPRSPTFALRIREPTQRGALCFWIDYIFSRKRKGAVRSAEGV